jgi:hypothetical protein
MIGSPFSEILLILDLIIFLNVQNAREKSVESSLDGINNNMNPVL